MGVNFQYENPLTLAVIEAAFEPLSTDGNTHQIAHPGTFWANPRKRGPFASESAKLWNQTRLDLATLLGVPVATLYLSGEPQNSPSILIQGFLAGAKSQGLEPKQIYIYHSPIDSLEVHAVADAHFFNGGVVGKIDPITFQVNSAHSELSVIIWQVGNIETGHIRSRESFRNFYANLPAGEKILIIDATAVGGVIDMATYLEGHEWDCIYFDAQSWGGPSGLSLISLNNEAMWVNPFPHIDNTVIAQSLSPILPVIAANVLNHTINSRERINKNRTHLISLLATLINSAIEAQKLPHDTSTMYGNELGVFSINIPGFDPVWIADQLSASGFAVDVGSACTSALLEPSYVLGALDLPNNNVIRLTIHENNTEDEITNFIDKLIKVLKEG